MWRICDRSADLWHPKLFGFLTQLQHDACARHHAIGLICGVSSVKKCERCSCCCQSLSSNWLRLAIAWDGSDITSLLGAPLCKGHHHMHMTLLIRPPPALAKRCYRGQLTTCHQDLAVKKHVPHYVVCVCVCCYMWTPNKRSLSKE